jgi:hypothetical protein
MKKSKLAKSTVKNNMKTSRKLSLNTRNSKILLVAALVLAGVLSYLVYGVVRDNLDKAKAAGWSNIVYLPTSNGYNPLQVMACKRDAGPLWAVTVFVYNGSTSSRSGSVGIFRNGTSQSSKTISLGSKQQAFYQFYASKYVSDTVRATFGTTGSASVSGLKDC